jgi:putative redox protein
MQSVVKAIVCLQVKTILTGKTNAENNVQIDYVPPLGDIDDFMPMELILVSLASCSGHTVLLRLINMGKRVEKLEVHTVGKRRDERPTVFASIELEYYLEGEDLDANSVEQAITLSEETYCPIWAMLNVSVALSSEYTIR